MHFGFGLGLGFSSLAAASSAPPELQSAIVQADGLSIILTYNKSLDEASTPAETRFTLHGTHATVKSSGVAVSGATVTLTFPTAIRAALHEIVTIDYDDGDANPIQDQQSNSAAALSGQTAANNSTFLADCVGDWDFMRADGFTEIAAVITGLKNLITDEDLTVVGAPAYSTTGLNGGPCADLNGTTDYFLGDDTAIEAVCTNNAPRTLFIVGALDVADSSFTFFGCARDDQETNSSFRFGSVTTGNGRWQYASVSDAGVTEADTTSAAGGVNDTNTSAHVIMCGGTATSTIRIDGENTSVNNLAHDAGTLTPNRYGLGCAPRSTPAALLDGKVGRMLLFDVELTQSTGVTCRDTVRAYLGALWGITVT